MFERFTAAAKDVVIGAQQESRKTGAGHVGTEHLLLAMLAPTAGSAHDVLREAGVSAARVREEVARLTTTRREVLGADDAAALAQVGIDLDQVLRRIEESLGADALRPAPPSRRPGPLRRRSGTGSRFTPRAREVLELSLREAVALGHREIGTGHLLLGLLREGRGLASQVLAAQGADAGLLRRAVLGRLSAAA